MTKTGETVTDAKRRNAVVRDVMARLAKHRRAAGNEQGAKWADRQVAKAEANAKTRGR